MLGREHEREAVQELARAAARGRGGVILVEGELGTGKSLLLSHAVSAASTAGVSVAAACADELSRFMPLGLLLQTLGESSAGLADEAGPSGP
ncbi:MAG TPA: AAA family ATPase, partial [Streptosporangiaceae bacterium]|nr:AAA family ATPase [Streptosporangiaceae bacterium]